MLIFILQPVLDPRINYEGLCAEARRDENDASQIFYLEKIELAKKDLKQHFLNHYAEQPVTNAQSSPVKKTPSRFNFDDYEPFDIPLTEEIDNYLKQRPLCFRKTPHPLKWWQSNLNTYPNVARFARDILSIPGICDCISI